MTRRRLVPLALVVTALLVVVAIAARGRPLGSGGGSGGGLPRSFWDYAFTTFLIFEGLLALVAAVAVFHFRRGQGDRQRSQSRTIRTLAILLAVAALVTLIGRHVDLHRRPHSKRPATTTTLPTATGGKNANNGRSLAAQHVHFRWDELAVVLGLLVGLGVLAAATRKRLGPPTQPRPAPEMLAAALDESLDDLRADPDLRRAIVAAYARMETTLAAAGLPRQPAEAPLEYVERALLTLDTSAGAVRRLTDLFEWARFSHHEPEPSMRDEAVDALVAVRDELRASELTAA